jgi:hypothetical protein
MELTPLALVVLLAYGLLIATCLTAWTAISWYGEKEAASNQAPPPQAKRVHERTARLSNDQVRGARIREQVAGGEPAGPVRAGPADLAGAPRTAAPAERSGSGERSTGKVVERPRNERKPAAPPRVSKAENEEDAFERFLRARPDDIDIR